MTTPYNLALTGTIDLDALAIALAPKVAAILGQTPAPPSPVPTPATTAYVYHDGKFLWAGDWSWGVQVDYSNTAGLPLLGPYNIAVTGNGGWQPYYANQDFDTTPYQYLVFSVKPTRDGAVWGCGAKAKGDVDIGVTLSDLAPFAVNLHLGLWTTYKIPLGAGGLQLPHGAHIEKFWIQDRSNNGSGTDSNTWYVDEAYFSA